jgi:putative glycerol-1-phosphate prenyltransferase
VAILLDPDKIVWENLDHLILKSSNHRLPIFSLAEARKTNIIDELIIRLKHKVKLPMVLFPEIHRRFLKADAILFLSLISGIGLPNRVSGKSCTHFKRTQLEIIPTGYILIESGNETAVGAYKNRTFGQN